ncbi:helicase POLQ-like [Maniola hyperantus]|uniref:helicase POLQ-like n=1 Tax=Aphantopus hyperantus TaxID=2795564 RepID=UPI001568DC6B|nr:helicase POLQ-like [Maniola hyperantus]
MNSCNGNIHGHQLTPKRRGRGTLGIRKAKLPKLVIKETSEYLLNSTPISISDSPTVVEKAESPCLPCNQVEFLCDTRSNGSICSEIPCSPGVLESENWDSFVASKHCNNISGNSKINSCVDNSVNMDEISELDQKVMINHTNTTLLTSRCEKLLRDEIEESFNMINQSISNINNENRSSLFETRDSFLLDIRESDIVSEQKILKTNDLLKPKLYQEYVKSNTFYGLPIMVKGLFKTYRNIEKFYDWQEECLSLDAIRERRNLIYALPTSGGKTLVAEVLMLREVLNRKQNALFILPFVAIVQEKIWSLAPFALQLEFLVEEYAAGKGHIPPKKRRKKNSIYIATIEKGLALVRSLIELGRLNEIGLIVVDELHLIGESGRGSTLETLLTTVIFANQGIQIVGMSATIGNLPDIAKFLNADVYEKQFRPVELTEYVKLRDMLHRIVWRDGSMEIVPDRQLAFDYSTAGATLDPDYLGGLVSEVVPQASCLVFCPTKRNCENVAALLCKLQRREMWNHRVEERAMLQRALRAEGAGSNLLQCVRFGVAFHHAGLAGDERSLLEHAFRSGVISVVCCTSTLAAGVNLPAKRVIVRAPLVGREFISLGAYKQMVGRAGRAGVCEAGESIIISGAAEWHKLRLVLTSGLPPACSRLSSAVGSLLLSAVALHLAADRQTLRRLLTNTLLAIAPADSCLELDEVCDDSIRMLLKSGALEPSNGGSGVDDGNVSLTVSTLGRAAIKGCMDLSVAKQLLLDLDVASRSLVLMGSLHLLYLVTPHDSAIRPDYRHYYALYCNLDEEGVQTAKILGITEMNAIRMMTGKPITNVPESVLSRFYLAMMLRDLWRQVPFPSVAEKYNLARGTVQSIMSSASAFASSAQKLCEELEPLWSFKVLFAELALRLRHCAAPELEQLMELPAVKKARALQLVRAGYKRIEDIAKASADELANNVAHLARAAADHLISAARVMLIEKVENLRAEAEDVMEELKI